MHDIRITYGARELIVTRLLTDFSFFLFFERERERGVVKYHVERQNAVPAKDVGRLIKFLLSVTKWLAKDVGRSIRIIRRYKLFC